jgi:osomolarity two-component system sensor histidine kinase NIK1
VDPISAARITDASRAASLIQVAGSATTPGSPLVVDPTGPLAIAAYESGMNAVDELKLLKAQVQDVARVCNAVAKGDLTQKITVKVEGTVMVQLKEVINNMVDNLGRFSAEVTRVSLEVGTEG